MSALFNNGTSSKFMGAAGEIVFQSLPRLDFSKLSYLSICL